MDERIVVGVDIGGSKIAAAAVTERGTICSRGTVPTEADRGFDDGLLRMMGLIDRVLSETERPRDALDAIEQMLQGQTYADNVTLTQEDQADGENI